MNLTKQDFFYDHNHERTFWIESIVPRFKIFGRLTNLVHFKWCETPTDSRSVATRDPNTLTSAPVRYMDGIGRIKHNEIILTEASSGAILEHVFHTRNDTVKLIAAAREVLDVNTSRLLNASFSSYLELKVLTILTAANVMTLRSVSYTEQDKYKVMEVRASDIPLGWEYEQRIHWFHMFDILATIMEILLEQEKVWKKLIQEKIFAGFPEEETIRIRRNLSVPST